MFRTHKKVNYKVVCINNKYNSGQIIDSLELNKTYVVLEVYEEWDKECFYKILELPGSVGVGGALYPKENFITLSELRRMKINKIKECLK